MFHERDVVGPVLRVLNESLLGELTTTEIRLEVKRRLPLDASDFAPLKNRPDHRIDQVIRNIKSHKNTAGNPICEGLLKEVPKGLRITSKGKAHLLP